MTETDHRLEFRAVHYLDPLAQQLVEEVQQEYVVRYGEIDRGPADPSEFDPPTGLFLVVLHDGEPVATGGYRRWRYGFGEEPTAELKRMFVRSSARGRGLSKVVLAELERRLREAGVARVVLETGTKQPEAIGLYASSGYEPVTGFGHYQDAPEQRCFGKDLPPLREA